MKKKTWQKAIRNIQLKQIQIGHTRAQEFLMEAAIVIKV